MTKKNMSGTHDRKLKGWLFVIMVLVLVKSACILFCLESRDTDRFCSLFSADVSAQEDNATRLENNPGRADNNTGVPGFEWSYELVKSIQDRETELRVRQEDLKKEEERLRDIKSEIDERIQILKEVEKRVAELIEAKKAVEDEKVHKLAKVFEATPPEQAGPLMSKLDVDIAAQLLLKMQGRKAGKIWGYVDPDKAVEISKELARLRPGLDLNKMGEQ